MNGLIKLNIASIILCLFFSCKPRLNETTTKTNFIPYYLKIYNADSLFLTKNFEKSFEILDSLNKKNKLKNLILNEKTTYLKSKAIVKRKVKELETEELITQEGTTLEYILNDSILSKVATKKTIKNYSTLRKIYLATINFGVRNQIKDMMISDQKFRSAKRSQNDLEDQKKIDSINLTKTIKIFEKNDYPNKYLIGDSNLDNQIVTIENILLHTNDSIRKQYFLPKILEFVKNGKCNPLVYAHLCDQSLLYKGQEQYFGSYETKNKKSKDEIKLYNKRRKEIGLWNIDYQDWRNKMMFYKNK